MRFLVSMIMSIFFVTPAFGASAICEMNGPHNCMEQSEDQLVALTQNTIHHLQFTQDAHPFKTQNDVVLEKAAKQQAQLITAPVRDYILHIN